MKSLILQVASLVLVICPALYVAPPIVASDEDLAKKYEKILGRYEFEIEGQRVVIAFLVREGGLWADSGDGRPAEIKPVNSLNEEFSGVDPDNGRFDVTFIKGEDDRYTKCRFVMKSQDVDAIGRLIE